MNLVYIWLAIVIVFCVVESISLDLSAIWFAFAAFVSMVFAFFSLPFVAQLIVFVIISAISMTAVKPVVKRYLNPKFESTNADRIIGETGLVIENIDATHQTGQIKVINQTWSAKSLDSSIVLKGNKVKVIDIKGVSAIVSKLEEEQ